MVELVFKHIEECEALEKKRYAGKNTEARVELFSGGKVRASPSHFAILLPAPMPVYPGHRRVAAAWEMFRGFRVGRSCPTSRRKTG